MDTRFARFSKGMVAHRKRVHIAVFILTLFMIPGALTALQPIDMESYEMESPELTAQTIIDTEFPTSEIILGFVVSVRDPTEVEDLSTWQPASTIDGGCRLPCAQIFNFSRISNRDNEPKNDFTRWKFCVNDGLSSQFWRFHLIGFHIDRLEGSERAWNHEQCEDEYSNVDSFPMSNHAL